MASPRSEAEYFFAEEQKSREFIRTSLEAKAKAAAEHAATAKAVGVDDASLAARIRELGFVGETARVLHLMPLVEVAWADGKCSQAERNAILQAAHANGIEPHSDAAIALTALLEERPSKDLLEQVLAVLKDLLAAKGMHSRGVLDACINVARASGGFLGLGEKISDEERKLIDQIAAAFGDDAKKQIADQLG